MNDQKRKVARKGMILTNGIDFGFEVDIAVDMDENSWYEITLEQYEKYIQAREEEYRRMYGENE